MSTAAVPPLIAVQGVLNAHAILICNNCAAILEGCPAAQCALASGRIDRAEASARALAAGGSTTPCAHACGALYCSPACRDAHATHALLCVGPVPDAEADAHPLVRFKRGALGCESFDEC